MDNEKKEKMLLNMTMHVSEARIDFNKSMNNLFKYAELAESLKDKVDEETRQTFEEHMAFLHQDVQGCLGAFHQMSVVRNQFIKENFTDSNAAMGFRENFNNGWDGNLDNL